VKKKVEKKGRKKKGKKKNKDEAEIFEPNQKCKNDEVPDSSFLLLLLESGKVQGGDFHSESNLLQNVCTNNSYAEVQYK
jgi:hypothetical protein